MNRKLRYWLLPLWAVMFYSFLKITGVKILVSDSLYNLLLLLPHYLLFLFSYKKGLQIFEPPTPSTKRSLFALLAAVCLIPLFYMAAYKINAVALAGDYDKRLEPVYSMNLHLAFLLAGLAALRILGLRPPRGKCLFMCFLPILLFAAVGTALILIAGSGFWVDFNIFNTVTDLSRTQYRKLRLLLDYFNAFDFYFPFVTSSFTVYWTMKFHHGKEERLSKTDKRELVYWIMLFAWAAFNYYYSFQLRPSYVVFVIISFVSSLLFPYLLICFPYLSLRNAFALPELGKMRTVWAAVALLCLLPLWLIISALVSICFSEHFSPYFTYNHEIIYELQPLGSICFNMILLILTLVLLRIVKLRPPKGKRLFICFLPVLTFTVEGVLILLISGSGCWISDFTSGGMGRINEVFEYFSYVTLVISIFTASVTVYEAVKYHHEQAKLAADQGSP